MKTTKTITLHFDEKTFEDRFAIVIGQAIDDAFSKYLQSLKMHDSTELLSRQEVADIYNVSFVTLRDWEKNGIIPQPIRKGSRVYWRKSDIISDVNRQKVNPK